MEASSGEAITALELARGVVQAGGSAHFLASSYTAGLIRPYFPDEIVELGADGFRNRQLWDDTVASADPDVVVFADYPLLFFSSGVAPIEPREEWAASLHRLSARLATLDHVGYAQKAVQVFFGPSHISFQRETTVPAPPGMEILLPCPLNAPNPVPGRRGRPFRAWSRLSGVSSERVAECRRKYLGSEDGALIFHSASTWAVAFAKAYRLPYYRFLPSFLDHYLADFPRPVTVVSVNGGAGPRSFDGRLNFIDSPMLSVDEFEACMLASDLVIGENRISVTLGKAVLRGIPAALLQNSFELDELAALPQGKLRNLILNMEKMKLGSVFPHQVFPIWSKDDLDQLGMFRENPLSECFGELELYGGESTRIELHALLGDEDRRQDLRLQQQAYATAVGELRGGADELAQLL